MAYSDQDLLVASQIAYYDFNQDILNDNNYSLSLKEIFSKDSSVIDAINKNFQSAGSDLEKSRAQSALDLYQDIVSGDSKYSNWVIKKVDDDNSNSGFYGCLIETSPDSAIVGFRGSENMADPEQLQRDWLNADVGLVNSTSTEQQSVAEGFMSDINNDPELHYSNYATTGHSLGGNLAEDATITAPDGMKDKITQCVSFDGPGFSNEYIAANADKIAQSSGKITHYQWSFVGALLNQVPGENYQSIKTKDEVYGKYDIASLTQKHDTSFVVFDENGNVIPGEMDNFAKSIGELSRNIDSCPSWMGNALVGGIIGVVTMPEGEKKAAGTALMVSLAALALLNPVTAVAVLVTIAAIVVIGFVDPEFYGKVLIPFLTGTASTILEIGEAIADGITRFVEFELSMVQFASELVNKIVEGVIEEIKGLVSWANNTFNVGYIYAHANPYIKINTYKLRSYADRLAMVNRRIANIDRQLDSLYGRVGMENLVNLIKADVFTGYSWRLALCINYLNETAEDFDNAEARILGQISKL